MIYERTFLDISGEFLDIWSKFKLKPKFSVFYLNKSQVLLFELNFEINMIFFNDHLKIVNGFLC